MTYISRERHKSTHELRRMVERETRRCIYCERWVDWDAPADVNDPQQVGDWNIDGDYGCEESPDTDDDGTGGHETIEDVIAAHRDYTAAVNGAIGILESQGYEGQDSGDALAVLRETERL